MEDLVEADELQRELGAQLGRLPRAQRVAVVLRHVADLPIAEVAEVLGCPEGTAKSHVSRGLHRLRALTHDGVSYLRTAESVHDDGEEFRKAYRIRYQRPLRPATRAPGGLLPALRGKGSAGLALDLRRLSDFERDVLSATRRIPTGETRPYAWVAREAGRPGAFRAVGSVLARNPVPLLIPCHRVVRSDGHLGQYIFGPSSKEALLRGEHANLDEVHSLAAVGVHYLGSDTTGLVCFPTCRNARRITPANRHGFRTLTSAVAAGYRPCRHCRPAIEEDSA